MRKSTDKQFLPALKLRDLKQSERMSICSSKALAPSYLLEHGEIVNSLANLFAEENEFFPSALKDISEMTMVLKRVLEVHSIKFATMESELSNAHKTVKQALWVSEELRARIKRKEIVMSEVMIRLERFDKMYQEKMRRKLAKSKGRGSVLPPDQ